MKAICGHKTELFNFKLDGYIYYSPPTSAEVKKTWIYTFTPSYAFIE
jgi:hypothetical protein